MPYKNPEHKKQWELHRRLTKAESVSYGFPSQVGLPWHRIVPSLPLALVA